MRGAFGKPQGTVARVHIGQVIMSIRTKLQNKEHVIEALRRAKFKFPGRQKVRNDAVFILSFLASVSSPSKFFVSPRSTSPRNGASLNLMQMSLKIW